MRGLALTQSARQQAAPLYGSHPSLNLSTTHDFPTRIIVCSPFLCHTRIQDRWASKDAVEDVSGLYGPGGFAAWLLVAGSALVSARHGSPYSPIDGELIGAIAYPLVAAMDTLFRMTTAMGGASLTAASRVAYSGLTLSALALCFTMQRTEGNLSPRARVWLGTTVVCFIASFISAVSPDGIPPLVTLGITLACMAGAAFYDCAITRAAIVAYLMVHLICVTLFLRRPGSLLPHTGAKWGDLDQAASLAITFITLAMQWQRQWALLAIRARSWTRRTLYRQTRPATFFQALLFRSYELRHTPRDEYAV